MMPEQAHPLIFLQLNEINFDLVEKYVTTHDLPGFKRLLSGFKRVETFAEKKYEELEPWIQWISAHSGKTYDEHRIFRLGDAAHSTLPQIFELLEKKGLKVGAISPMNARNDMEHPAYFVPDPWTITRSDDSGFSRRLTAMLRQTVNENAQGRVSKRSLLTIAEAFARTITLRGGSQLFRLVRRAKGRQWIKAMVLDQLIHMVHLYQLRRCKPDVSFVFLNAGAHVQHHYLFNSPHVASSARNPAWYVSPDVDPFLEMLQAYDHMLMDYMSLAESGAKLIVATGLTQVAYDRVKFYYRLKDHTAFLATLGIEAARVLPRMTRDFEVVFVDPPQAQRAANVLQGVRMERDQLPLFGDIENRGASLFVTLTYPTEILPNDSAVFAAGVVPGLLQHVAFVAIKNGMHSPKGFAFFSPAALPKPPEAPVHVAALFQLTLDAAGV